MALDATPVARSESVSRHDSASAPPATEAVTSPTAHLATHGRPRSRTGFYRYGNLTANHVRPLSAGPPFDGEVGGRVVVERSTTPFLDGARRLVEFGHDGKAMLVMKHLGTDAVALRAKLAAAAGLTVDKHGIPRFKRWKPWGGDAVHAENDIGQPGSNHAALLALWPLRARARAEINAIDREADPGFRRAPLRARRSRLPKLIDPLDQTGPRDRREVWDG